MSEDLSLRHMVPELYLTDSVHRVVLQKSIHEHIRQLILHVSNQKGYVGGFVWELAFA